MNAKQLTELRDAIVHTLIAMDPQQRPGLRQPVEAFADIITLIYQDRRPPKIADMDKILSCGAKLFGLLSR